MLCVRHVGIVVRDLEPAVRFYEEALGLVVVQQQEETGPYLDAVLGLRNARATTVKMSAAEGPTLVELLEFHSHPDDRHSAHPYSLGPTHVAFTVADLWHRYEQLSERGVCFTAPPRHSPDGRALVTFCRDPEGNLIELVEVLAVPEVVA
ncbi:MAG: VOC family protein [Planctomycetota bacterium]|jgi:catechol 2,3-dioxygenase-like lactoylglutathione lyase family enzyme